MELQEYFFTMSGPTFLVLYGIWFLVVYAGLLVLRKSGIDSPGITLGALLLFEGVGLLRIIGGMMHGLERWGFLILMMLVGGVLFLVRWTSTGAGGGSSGWVAGGGCGSAGGSCGSNLGGSSGSSCGGASCSGGSSCGGGGGCGGCGGS